MPSPDRPTPPPSRLDAIAADALSRDRARLDPEALLELKHPILATGLRMPIELVRSRPTHRPTAMPPAPPHPRLTRHRARRHASLTAMVEENAIRADVSPWEQAMVAVRATEADLFDTTEAAIDALYARFNRDKR